MRPIGRYPIVSLQGARIEARRRLAEYTLGKTTPPAITFGDAVGRFLEAAEKRNKPRTVRDYRRLLKRHFPFAATRLADISPADVVRRIERLSSTPAEQNHAFVAAQVFFRFAVRQHWLDRSPCERMTLPNRAAARDRVLTDNEIKAVWNAAEAFGFPFGTIIQLCILTGQRRSEIARLRRDYLDLNAKIVTLLPAETKNSRQHTFPLGAMAAAIIEKLDYSSPYLFPARREFRSGTPAFVYNAWSKDKRNFDLACAIAHWTLHDLRRTFSTNLAALNTPPHLLERLLNHSAGTISGVSAIYNRFQYIDEMRTAMEKWEQKLFKLLNAPP